MISITVRNSKCILVKDAIVGNIAESKIIGNLLNMTFFKIHIIKGNKSYTHAETFA